MFCVGGCSPLPLVVLAFASFGLELTGWVALAYAFAIAFAGSGGAGTASIAFAFALAFACIGALLGGRVPGSLGSVVPVG